VNDSSRKSVSRYLVDYGRDGWNQGQLFVGRNGDALDLTTPSQIIRFSGEDAFEFWAEVGRLFGFKTSP
jgi:hypothetical protein